VLPVSWTSDTPICTCEDTWQDASGTTLVDNVSSQSMKFDKQNTSFALN
jgi:hypothetical protein